MSEYTPDNEARTPNANTVRSVFVRAHPFSASTRYEDRRAEFDRFIAKVKADALREASTKLRDGIGSCNTGCHVSDMMTLQSLADRIESGDGQ